MAIIESSAYLASSTKEIDDTHSEADLETRMVLAAIVDAIGRNSVLSPDLHKSCSAMGSTFL
jgi:hypothetical protein